MADEERQPEAQAPAEIECANCWRVVENRSVPNMGGPSRDNWVHVPGGFQPCFPQRGADSPRAEPELTVAPQPEIVHGCPPEGSGLTPCCGRTPFELPLTDRISSEAPVTCPAPAVVAEPGKENGPRTVCVCGHTKGEHIRIGGPFGQGRLLCDSCDPDSTENLVCKEFEAP